MNKLFFVLIFVLPFFSDLQATDRISSSFANTPSVIKSNIKSKNLNTSLPPTDTQACFSSALDMVSVYHQTGLSEAMKGNYLIPKQGHHHRPAAISFSGASDYNESQMRQLAEQDKRMMLEREQRDLQRRMREKMEEERRALEKKKYEDELAKQKASEKK